MRMKTMLSDCQLEMCKNPVPFKVVLDIYINEKEVYDEDDDDDVEKNPCKRRLAPLIALHHHLCLWYIPNGIKFVKQNR